MKRKVAPAILLSFALISCWVVVATYVLGRRSGTSFGAGTGITQFEHAFDFPVTTGISLFVLSIFQIILDLKLKGSRTVAILFGIFLPPFAAFLIQAIPLLMGGPLRGDAGLLILVPFIAAQMASTLIPVWIIFGFILNSIARDVTTKNTWLKSVGAIFLLIVLVTALFGFGSSSEKPFALVREGKASELKELLDQGLSPNILDHEGISLLHYGIFHRSLDVVSVLLEHGADADFKNSFGDTALSYVGPFEDKLFDLVLKYSKNVSHDERSYWNSINSGNVVRVRKLIESGQKFHITEGEGSLRLCVDKNNIEMLKLLLDSGSDPNSIDSYFKRTPLMLAAGAGKIEFVKVLLDKGADLKLKDRDGRTASDYSKYSNSTEVSELLK